MDSNPIHHLSPAIKLKCLFLDFVQILMISWAGWWTWTPSATPLQPKKWNAHFLDCVQLLMIGWAGQWTWTPYTNSLQPKQWNAHFSITFNFWWLAGLVDRLEPHLPPLSSLKMKCSFLDYIQLLMIGQVSQWTRTPSAIPLQPKKLNAHFWIMFIFWWLGRLVDGLEPHLPPLSSHKIEMLIFGLC